MDYQSNIEHSYEYTLPQGMENSATDLKILIFLNDGSMGSLDYSIADDNTILSMCGRVSNYVNQNYGNLKMVAFETINYNNGYATQFFYTNYVDYVITGEHAVIMVGKYNDFALDEIGDISNSFDYPTYNQKSFSSYTYSSYGAIKNEGNSNLLSVYDFSNIHYSNNDYYYTDVYTIRGEGYSFYTHSQTAFNYNYGTKYFAYGRPLASQRNAEYTRGYSSGYATGWTNGLDQGYQQGVNAQGLTNQTINTPMAVIGQGFGAVGNILSLEILPNITLGLCVAIPFTFVLIKLLFSLVKK